MDEVTQDILNLRALSSRTEDYVCNQLYVSKYGQDEVKDSDILLDCYELIIEELEDLGIKFWDTQNSMLGDWFSARFIYYFRKVFDEETLTTLMLQNKSILPQIEAIINSDEADDSNIHLVLEVLDSTFKDHPDIVMCIDRQDTVISTSRFNDHLASIIHTVNHLAQPTIDDVSVVANYIKQIQLGRNLVKVAVDKLLKCPEVLEGSVVIDNPMLTQLIEMYDMDKVQPTEIIYYANLDIPDDKLDPAFKNIKQQYMDKHHTRSPHHIEYWVTHTDKQLTATYLLVLVAHHYTTYINPPEFVEALSTMKKTGAPILTDEHNRIIDIFSLRLMDSLDTA